MPRSAIRPDPACAVACLAAAATTRYSYRRARLGHVGAAGLIGLDFATTTVVVLAAPVPLWPATVAVAASLTRIAVTARRIALPRSA